MSEYLFDKLICISSTEKIILLDLKMKEETTLIYLNKYFIRTKEST